MKRDLGVLVLNDSDDDKPGPSTRRRIAAPAPSVPSGSKTDSSSRKNSSTATTGSSGNSERAELERARLARVQQLEVRGDSTKTTTVRTSTTKSIATLASISSNAHVVIPDAPGPSNIHGLASSTSTSAARRDDERFWQGEIRPTYSKYHSDDISIAFHHLFGDYKSVQAALVGAYVTDELWVMKHSVGDFPLMLVRPRPMGVKEDVSVVSPELREKTFMSYPRERKLFGNESGPMHVKVAIIYHLDHVRIAIPSANSIDYDWNRIENAVYLHDFKRRSEVPEGQKARDNPTNTSFSSDFLRFMTALGARERFLQPLVKYEFSTSADTQLVWSQQGWHEEWDGIDSGGGIASLARAVKALGFAPGGTWEIECAGSSLGEIPDKWLRQMLAACSGIPPAEYLTATRTSPSVPGLPLGGTLPIKIVFPTLAEVDETHAKRAGGGTLFFPEKYWNDGKWPKHLLHQGKCKRRGILAHTKTILAIHKPANASGPFEGWIYVGSHNFTQSAWGRLSKNHGSPPKIGINNWELGCVTKFAASSLEALERIADSKIMYQRPLQRYSSSDVPWMQNIYRTD